MATVNCPKCSNRFDPKHYLAKSGGLAAGAAAGAWIGSSVGLVAGPIGGMAGTVPGAIIGGVLGWLGISKFARCPQCSKVFKI
jgi:hypothetical protein